MIDRERVLRKLDLVRHHVVRLRAKLPATPEALLGDEDLRDILSNNLARPFRVLSTSRHMLSLT